MVFQKCYALGAGETGDGEVPTITQFMIRLRWSIFTLIVCQKEKHHGETYILLKFFPYPISDIKFYFLFLNFFDIKF